MSMEDSLANKRPIRTLLLRLRSSKRQRRTRREKRSDKVTRFCEEEIPWNNKSIIRNEALTTNMTETEERVLIRNHIKTEEQIMSLDQHRICTKKKQLIILRRL